ncbi:hypothetical protein LTR09_007301 [Extremus antarcticus]|uniref:Myosin class II heavy chain n=1 Tax=Extremus antarcticus TaxID=702011 RepID=A0AAJ0DKI1_9PEZI|nr:hypothetical protein LTR09_007301 [Extremus antarcticus]
MSQSPAPSSPPIVAVAEPNTALVPPPPRTPASSRSKQDTGSDYHTAIWGSPYDLSSSLGSAHTARSEQAYSEVLSASSPSPAFSLQHLIPSRLSSYTSEPGPPTIEASLGAEEDSDVTPRSRTKRWVELPRREEKSDRAQWWSDESRQASPVRHLQQPRRVSSSSEKQESSTYGHPSRESNRTLDQQTFWKSLRERRSSNMSSSLYASRWADTPPAEEGSAAPILQEKPVQGLSSSRWADTPPPAEAEESADATGLGASGQAATPPQDVEGKLDDAERQVGEEKDSTDNGDKTEFAEKEEVATHLAETDTANVVPGMEAVLENGKSTNAKPSEDVATGETQDALSQDEPSTKTGAGVLPSGVADGEQMKDNTTVGKPLVTKATPMRSSPRSKKKVSWRGKTCAILIPDLDYETQPMTVREAEAHIRTWEDRGYDIRGFDTTQDYDASYGPMSVKPIFPDEAEAQNTARQDGPKVQLPDLNKWRAYMDHLTEQKLAALGVGLVADEPTSDMSRQSSAQYPPLPFSPPLLSSSANRIGRPGMVRGHSHTMSVASPISPLNGPMGHMRAQSTFTGFQQQSNAHGLRTFSPPQQQQQQQPNMAGLQSFSPQPHQQAQQPGFPGMQPLSPHEQYAIPGFQRAASPAQLAALRNAVGGVRAPGSPLSQQLPMQSYQSHNRSQTHGGSSTFTAQAPSFQPAPALPELPEEDDEDELLEQVQPQAEPQSESPKPAYVPPHKRAELNENIAVPKPRHRHNISEGLERDILEAEQRHEASRQQWIEVEEEASDERQTSDEALSRSAPAPKTIEPLFDEKDPLSLDIPVQESPNNHKRNGSKFKSLTATAPTFKFNPGATFDPGSTSFSFGASAPQADVLPGLGHNRNQSSSTLNVAAPEFKPSGFTSVPKSDFSFASGGPVFKPDAPSFEPVKRVQETLSSIFGKVDIPSDIVRPTRRSKAVAIKPPEEIASASEAEFEDDQGRPAQSDERFKRQRKFGDDGDEVPRFAAVTPMPAPIEQSQELGASQMAPPIVDDKQVDGATESQPATYRIADVVDPLPPPDNYNSITSDVQKPVHGHKHSTSLSALAKPFEPFGSFGAGQSTIHKPQQSFASISELEEGELKDDSHPPASPFRDVEKSISADEEERSISPLPDAPMFFDQPASARVDTVADIEPSFDEIDAVMRQLNEADVAREVREVGSISPMSSTSAPAVDGVAYLPTWSRSDAPSPSPKRRQLPFSAQADSSFTNHDRTDSVETPVNGWADISRLNKTEELPTSDWSGVFSAQDEEKLHIRGQFFDSHIESLIGSAVERRLQPLEESLRTIEQSVGRRPISRDLAPKRSSSAVDGSDADDEDDSEEQRQRPISRGKDKRVDQIKIAVLEAIREHGLPQQEQSSQEIQDLHAVLADMKMSFARAASSGLELDDVRALVEDAVGKQSQALVPVSQPDGNKDHAHKREVSELQGRLNETLAGALEEANRRHAVEEREVETKRMLRLAEEEVQLQRDTSRDNESRMHASEREREDLLRRLEDAEDARRDAEDRTKDLEAEHEAAQATLEEYRMSSNRWRQDIDEATRDREEMENTIASLEHELEESQDMSGSMRRRLEKLHTDMASAAGQLASEKAARQVKEDEYRVRCEQLEVQQSSKEAIIEEELNVLRASATEAAEAKVALEQLRISNETLEETVRKLQVDLTEQQSLAARFERESSDAKELGRSEVERTRLAMQADVEAANTQVNVVRVELESELSAVRSQLENFKMEAEDVKARHSHQLEEDDAVKREMIRNINHANSVALDEARQKYEISIRDLTSAHDRALSNAIEDKQRSEYFLNERLSLSDAKLQHFQDRVLHLEERLEVTKSAAQAAAMNAQGKAMPSSSTNAIPEKVSPQALRESILVLQEQLQERELTIDHLRNQADERSSTEMKQRDDEIAWLRELLAVRSEELTDLVNILAQPTFDRAAVRDTAIRIRANLQMEQQEKDRFAPGSSLPGQAIASLSNFAAPKLGAAFSKWRSTMESSALRHAPKASTRPRSSTPSRAPAALKNIPAGYAAGLLTPPASNFRSTPSPEATKSLPQPRLHSSAGEQKVNGAPIRPSLAHSRQPSALSDGPTTPLFRSQSYDQDAEDNSVHMQSFEDEDLDVADSQPPAFRSLEAELDSVDGDGSLA